MRSRHARRNPNVQGTFKGVQGRACVQGGRCKARSRAFKAKHRTFKATCKHFRLQNRRAQRYFPSGEPCLRSRSASINQIFEPNTLKAFKVKHELASDVQGRSRQNTAYFMQNTTRRRPPAAKPFTRPTRNWDFGRITQAAIKVSAFKDVQGQRSRCVKGC